MLIAVIYQNGKYGLVESSNLDELISSNKIKKFLRSEDWCILGIDPTRKESNKDYKGYERRRSLKQTNKDNSNNHDHGKNKDHDDNNDNNDKTTASYK
jgi:hypothetical protein